MIGHVGVGNSTSRQGMMPHRRTGSDPVCTSPDIFWERSGRMPWPDGVAAVSTRILQVGALGHRPFSLSVGMKGTARRQGLWDALQQFEF